MALLRQFYTNFTSGELSPLLSSRIDTQAYQNGVKKLRNGRVMAQGGVTRRPGLKYLQTLSNINYQTEAYVYDEDEAYIILFSNGRIDIVDQSSPTTIAASITSGCPWSNTQIGGLVVAQSGDTMIIVHPDLVMKKLTRTSASNFSLSDYEFDLTDGMLKTSFYKFVSSAITITPAATSGTTTLTASATAFTSNMVGTYLRLVDSANTVRQFKITGYTSGTVVTGDLSGSLSNTNAILNFTEEVFSARRGYARTVIFHDQRLVFGGSRDLPNHIFMSKAGEFYDFDVGTGADDEAIQLQIAENQVSEIKALASLRHLTVFTSEQELFIPTSENRPLTPATITIKKQTSFGSGAVQPLEFDGAVVFLTKSKGAIREFVFSDLSQAYNSDALTLLSQDLINNPVDMASQRESADQVEGYLYVVNSDGTLPVFMSIRKEKLQGWFRYETTGSFKNIVNVNRQMFCVVERTINSSTVTFLEELDNDQLLDASVNLTSGSATQNFTASHLPNTSVHVRSGSYSLGSYTTNGSGQVTLSDAVTSCEIGVNYTPEITTLPAEFQLNDGLTVGQKRRIVRAVLDLHNTLNVKTKGTTILIRSVTDDFSVAPQVFTGRKEVYLLGWSSEGTVTIKSEEPLQMTINGIMLEVEV